MTDTPLTAAQRADARNTGHGHVFPRPDGRKARCGGPALCGECARDLARKTAQEHGGPGHHCDPDCPNLYPGLPPSKQVGTVTVKVVPEFDVVEFLRDAAAQMLAEADRLEQTSGWDAPEKPYCAEPSPPTVGGGLPFRCTRDAGHEGRHAYAGTFWD